MSTSSSPAGSPVRPTNKSQLPASIANASLEELQKLFVDSLKKLKARDKKIIDLTASNEALQGQVSQQALASAQEDLQQRLQAASDQADEAERQAADAQAQFEGMYKTCAMQTQQLEDVANEKTVHAEQMASLKEVLRAMALEKDAAEKVLAVNGPVAHTLQHSFQHNLMMLAACDAYAWEVQIVVAVHCGPSGLRLVPCNLQQH